MSIAALPASLKKVKSQLKKELEADRVDVEKVPGLSRYRIAVVSPRFARMPHMTRQDRVWKIVDNIITPAEAMRISLILAFSPAELKVGKTRKAK